MAENGFKTIIFSYGLIVLFGMLIMMAIVSIGSDYDMDTSQIAGGSLAIDKFNESVSSIEANAKNLKADFDSGSIWSALAGVVVEGIFGIAKNMVKMILLPIDIIIDILSDVFGVPYYVTSVVLGMLIMSIIFAIWRLLKVGD